MLFFGNGIVRLDRDNMVRFNKPAVKHTKGSVDIKDVKIQKRLIALGYEYDPATEEKPVEKPPVKRAAYKPAKDKVKDENGAD